MASPVTVRAVIVAADDERLRGLVEPSSDANSADQTRIAVLITANDEPVGAVVAHQIPELGVCDIVGLSIASGLAQTPALAHGLKLLVQTARDNELIPGFDPPMPLDAATQQSLVDAGFVTQQQWTWLEIDGSGARTYCRTHSGESQFNIESLAQASDTRRESAEEHAHYVPHPDDLLNNSFVAADADDSVVGLLVVRGLGIGTTAHWLWVAPAARHQGVLQQLGRAFWDSAPSLDRIRVRVRDDNPFREAVLSKSFVRELWHTRTWRGPR